MCGRHTRQRARRSRRTYFPRDLFFCFFTFKLTIGAFAPVPRDGGLGVGCFFDFPAMRILLDRGREATDDPTLQAVPMRCRTHRHKPLALDARKSETRGSNKRAEVRSSRSPRTTGDLSL
jgi:hypothetical protein